MLVITSLARGGAEAQTTRLALRLRARRWAVHVVCLTPPEAYVEELEEAGVLVTSLGIRHKLPDPRILWRLRQCITGWRPHVVHGHMVHANLLVRLVRPLVPVPAVVCTAHSVDERGRFGSGCLRVLAYRLTDHLCDLTTQVSQAGLERYVSLRAAAKHKIRLVPNGVDTECYRADPAARCSLRDAMKVDNLLVWIAVGRLMLPKDYPTMLQAFARLARERPAVVLLIVGDGPLRSEMEQLARILGVAERVRFLGIRQDVPDLLNAADAYVMSSAWEGMPMVLLEAHAAGLPVAATDVGGNREVVANGLTGYLVPPKDPEALARAMLRLMDLSAEERSRMSTAARSRIVANFSLDHVVDLWEDLYRELLAQKGVRVE